MKNSIFLLLAFSFIPLFAKEPTLLDDASHFYSKKTALFLGKVLVPAAIMANTSIDQKIQDFYQNKLRDDYSDQFSQVAKIVGSNMPLTIAFVSGITTSYLFKDTSFGKKTYDYCMNSFRATITGFPLLVAGQVLIGCDRPSQYTSSAWQPLKNDHGVSGHAYMGAIPFITAANMTRNRFLKGLFLLTSTATGISRINDNQHFASQVILGWSLAYAACSAVQDSNLIISATTDSLSLGYTF